MFVLVVEKVLKGGRLDGFKVLFKMLLCVVVFV